MDYFVESDGRKVGPYDAMGMIRKIRCGKLSRTDVVWLGWQGERVNVLDVPLFAAVIEEYEESLFQKELAPTDMRPLEFRSLITEAVETVAHALDIVVLGGVMLALALAGAALAMYVPVVGGLVCGVWIYFFLCMLQVCVLRRFRMQLLTVDFITAILRRFAGAFFMVALVLGGVMIGLPVSLTMLLEEPALLLLLVLPGSILWLVSCFTPLLIVDRGVSPLAAIVDSVHVVRKLGVANITVIYTFIVGMCIVAPTGILLVIALPLVMLVLCQVYDQYFLNADVL